MKFTDPYEFMVGFGTPYSGSNDFVSHDISRNNSLTPSILMYPCQSKHHRIWREQTLILIYDAPMFV